jgi:hypothetical protein
MARGQVEVVTRERNPSTRAGRSLRSAVFAFLLVRLALASSRGAAQSHFVVDSLLHQVDAGAFEVGALPAGLIFEDGFEIERTWYWN